MRPFTGTKHQEADMPTSASRYVLGRSEREYMRLMVQSRLMRPWTERYMRAAGLRPGDRVLDLGSGVGDVSLLAASIVGPEGSVLGIERDADAIETARQRVEAERLSEIVRFEVADVNSLTVTEQFDAVVGRFFLVYQPDPVATVQRAAALLRPGGVLVLHEMDAGAVNDMSWPPCPVYNDSVSLLFPVFAATGAHTYMGRMLAHTFLEAGLERPAVEIDTPVATGPDSPVLDWMARTVQSLEPMLAAEGLSLPAGVDFDDLLPVWKRTITEQRAQFVGPSQYGAWARVS
ncbi:SAM-dependent methyltransferase [Streptomyces tendae]|uniref:SAM-dependent methyltransferase n=1 Tax=Streptomyces tendae TaxID=1932 RepID=UPI003D707C9D